MQKDIKNGWWGAPATRLWLCPECGVVSPVTDWEEVEPYCEDCGTHDGRKCPNCEEWIDHVWGAETIKDGNLIE